MAREVLPEEAERRSGDRSAMAADALTTAGRDAVSLAGGVTAWGGKGLPTEKG